MDSMNAEPNVVGIGDTRRPPLRLVMTVIPPPVYASSRAFTWVSGVYLRSWPFMRLFFGGGGGRKLPWQLAKFTMWKALTTNLFIKL